MKQARTTRIATATAAGLIALGALVSSASAAGFTLSLTASSTPVVGKPLMLTATGTTPVQDLQFPYFFSLDAIPTRVTTTCPADRWVGAQFASNGGSIVVLTQAEHPDAAGNFSIPVAVTPSAPGSVLLCAYTDDGAAATLAASSLTLNIQPKSSSTGARPNVATISADARGGIRSCLALLGRKDGAGCLRSVVRRANAACRRLHSQSGRTSCLKAVRKITRRYV
jgi:hypothetical protein